MASGGHTAQGQGGSCICKCADRGGPGQEVGVAEGGGPGQEHTPAISPEPEFPLTLGYVGTSRRGVSFLLLSTKLYLQGQLVLQEDSQD